MKNNKLDNPESKRLSKDDLWAKAGTDQPITREDVGLSASEDESGLRRVRDGLNILRYSDDSEDIYKGSDE